jgi:hypothetical protein
VLKIYQIVNPDKSVTYLLVLNGREKYLKDSNYFAPIIGFNPWFREQYVDLGTDCPYLLAYENKSFVNGKPSQVTTDLGNDWTKKGFQPPWSEKMYFLMRDPSQP